MANLVIAEDDLRVEFERQHAGRNLLRHRLRGTYSSPTIAALWNQHVRTAQWLSEVSAAAMAAASPSFRREPADDTEGGAI